MLPLVLLQDQHLSLSLPIHLNKEVTIRLMNSGKSTFPVPSGSTSFYISAISDSVGFRLSDLTSNPKSETLMTPSPSLSNKEKASL